MVKEIFESSLFCIAIPNGGKQKVEVSLFMFVPMTIPLRKSFINCSSCHIRSGSSNYEVQNINSHMEGHVGFVVEIVEVNIFFFPYFGILSSL
jgi:hypothetical protein